MWTQKVNGLRSVSSSTYKKLFICDVYHKSSADRVIQSSKWMKIALFGVVVAIKVYPERILYTVDDGTGMLDCSIKAEANPVAGISSYQGNSRRKNKIACATKSKDEESMSPEYVRGDALIAYGYIYMVKKTPRLEVIRHYKVKDPNEENTWMTDQLMLYHEEY